MAVFRKVHTEFWQDPKVLEEMTPEDKYFMLYLLTNPNTTQIGIYQISKKTMAFELGYSMESINALMDRFINNHKIVKYNNETREIAIKNWGRYNLNRGGKPIEDCVKSELKEVKERELIKYVLENITNSKLKSIYKDFYESGEVEFKPSRGSTKGKPLINARQVVIARDEKCCFYTGKKLKIEDIEVDHIVPKVLGGSDSTRNLVVTSKTLNNLKSGNDLKRFCETAGLDLDEILERIRILNDYEDYRKEKNITNRKVIEEDFTIRKYKSTIRGQEEEEEEEEEKEKEKEKEIETQEEQEEVDKIILTKELKEKIIIGWNKLPVADIRTLSESRSKKIKILLQTYGEEDLFKAIDNINRSKFLQGINDRGWVITIDWFLKGNNFIKVLEGNYNKDKQRAKKKGVYKVNSDREEADYNKIANRFMEGL